MLKPKIIYQVDAFTSKPFKGNPAGVCILDKKPTAKWMQNVAMEMNLSETAFVIPGKSTSLIRFFSPEAEIDLCGHATLSACHILFETGRVKLNEVIKLSSRAGILSVTKSGPWIKMNFPAYSVEKMTIPDSFRKLTGKIPGELYRTAHGWTLALLKSEKDVREMSPDFQSMKNSQFGDLIVTAPSADPEFDFCVRCFAPALGINEDPVTGSAHCALVPFWYQKTGRSVFISHQVSKREGILKVTLKGNRVEISGKAITIFRAELFT